MRPRPNILSDEHLVYLDNLRSSGVTNMLGAPPYVQRRFKVSGDQAREIVSYWMATFSERNAQGKL